MQFEVKRVVGMLPHRGLMDREHIGHPEPPQGVVAADDLAQHECQRAAAVLVQVQQRRSGRLGSISTS